MEASNGDSPTLAGNFIATNASPNSHSSPENSPNQMDTSVELNGLKSSAESRSSQQFCLRWNNHQVRSHAQSKFPFKSIGLGQPNCTQRQLFFPRSLHSNCIPTPIFLRRIFLLWLLQNAAQMRKEVCDWFFLEASKKAEEKKTDRRLDFFPKIKIRK